MTGRRTESEEPRLEADFNTLVSMVATQVFISLGRVPHPIHRGRSIDLNAARYHLAMLEVLRTKTRGNLEPDEQKLLDNLCDQLTVGLRQAQAELEE